MTSLAGRTLTIIGGNGLVGSHVAKEAVHLGAKVISISRSGKPPQTKEAWTEKVQWVSGNSISPNTFESALVESEVVLHTPGVLIDDAVTKGKKPGEPGTYEYVNRDTAINLGKKLAELKNKKLVYMSASKSLPFIPRYLQAKREAENFLFAQPDLKFVSLRPGFITTNEIFVKRALRLPVSLYAGTFSFVNNLLPDSRLKDFLGSNFDVDYPIDVRHVAIGALIAAFDSKFDGKILYNSDLNSLTSIYLERGYKFPSKMSNLEYQSLQPTVEFQLPYMFASEMVLKQKVDIPHIIRELSAEKEHVGLNVKFPITITKQQTPNNARVLIKVRKFKNKKTGEIKTKEEVIGIVGDQFSYEELADFHFESKIPQGHLINHLKTSHKTLTDYYENVLSHQKEKKEDKTRFQAKFIHFESHDVPIPDPFPESIENKPEYKYLVEKFEKRPVWLKNALLYEAEKINLKFDSYHTFKKILSYLAYSFKDGPWKHAYVKFKVDPRADPNTFIYQVIDVGSSESNLKGDALSQAYKRNDFETYDPYFIEPPTKQRQLYQLCDLQDQQILDILERERDSIIHNDTVKCDKKNGWIEAKELKAILKFMKSKFKLA